MKSFIAPSLFAAFVAFVRTEDFANFDVEANEPGFFQCKVDLYNCFKDGNETKTGCLSKYKTCMASLLPTMPYFVIFINKDMANPDHLLLTLCKMDLSWCTTHSQDWKETGTCYLEFSKCLKDGGPTPVTYAPELAAAKMDDQPTRGQFAQCQIDLYDCNNRGDKTAAECLTDYKTCMAQLIPPYVETCNQEFKECENNASGFLEKAKCATDFAVCLKNGGPTTAPAL